MCLFFSWLDGNFTKSQFAGRQHRIIYGAIQLLRNAFSWEFDPPPTPRNANNVFKVEHNYCKYSRVRYYIDLTQYYVQQNIQYLAFEWVVVWYKLL